LFPKRYFADYLSENYFPKVGSNPLSGLYGYFSPNYFTPQYFAGEYFPDEKTDLTPMSGLYGYFSPEYFSKYFTGRYFPDETSELGGQLVS